MGCCESESESEFEYLECAKVGQKIKHFAPDAYDPAARAFTSVDFEKILAAGKWLVLVFYPADFTFVCPTELADLAARQESFTALNAVLATVSTDTKYVHLAWKDSEKLLADVKFLMAADPSGEVSRYFDVWDPDSGLDLRGTFIVDPDGVLAASEINLGGVGRNADELLRKLAACAHLREHPQEACPARWSPGARTLSPSIAMVGRVSEALAGK